MNNSLSFRIIVLSVLWSIISLICVAYFMGQLYKENAQEKLDELLTAHMYQVISHSSLDNQGNVQGNITLGDSRFKEPYSGWYWLVFPAFEEDGKGIFSASLAGENLNIPDENAVPFDDDFLRYYSLKGLKDQELIAVERKLFLDDSEKLYHVVLTSNGADLESEVANYQQFSIIILSVLVLASIISTALIVWLGLKPLKQVPIAIDKILQGDAQKLQGEFPTEIQPLVSSTNALIEANSKIVERSRTHVGNLAHALKTPLSVLLNEAREANTPLAQKVNEQAEHMQQHIQYYLDRARISAQKENFTAQCDVVHVLERLVRVMDKLNPKIEFDLKLQPNRGLMFRGEQQDLEELAGNLIENAAKFAQKKVTINAKLLNEQQRIAGLNQNHLVLKIEDDGIGLSDEEINKVIKRGERLDESKPGSGLGLSIVKDIVEAYGGQIDFGKAHPKGLSVEIYLSGFIKS